MADRAPQSLALRVIDALRGAVGEGQLLVASFEPRRDRYGRLRAQLFDAQGGWLQRELLEDGLVRVAIAPDRTECAAELFAAEAQARRQSRGLWQLPQFRIRAPRELRSDIGSFQIVEGRVRGAFIRAGEGRLIFADGFFATIAPEDMRSFHETGVDPRGYAGQTIRIRGLVLAGPSIAVASPQSVEVVQ